MFPFQQRSSGERSGNPSPLPRKSGLGRVAIGVLYAVLFAVFFRIQDAIMLIPLIPAYAVVSKFSEKLFNQPADLLVLDSVPSSALPEAARHYFDQHTPELERLGFRLIGDFSLKRKSTQFGRFFINREGTEFAEISHLSGLMTKIQACSFFSVTDAFVYIETGNLRMPHDDRHSRFVLRGISGASLVQLLEAHRQLIAEHSNEDVAAPISFFAQDLAVVCLYGQKMLYDSLVAQRMATSNPYAHITLADVDSRYSANLDAAAEPVPIRR